MEDRNQVAQALLSNYTPSWREQIGNSIYDVVRALMPSTANRMREEAMMAVDFIPGVGDAVGVDDAYRDYQAGNYGSAAFNAGTTLVGAVPGAGDLAAGVAKAIFGGIAAKTADRAALETAQQLAATGADRQAIWDATGWFQGPDGQWRFEIDDSGSQFRGVNPEPQQTPIRAAMKHPELYAAYPDLIPISVHEETLEKGMRGYYNSAEDKIGLSWSAEEPHSTLLHEIQHGVQTREGFARGASPTEYASGAMFHEKARNLQGDLSKELTGGLTYKPQDIIRDLKYADPARVQAIVQAHGFSTVDEALAFLKQQDEMRTPMSQYKRTAGEVEARNVQARMNMTPEQRRATPPWETQDVPDELQIVRRR